ncbi:MAG: hypothetical protein ACK5QW_06095 [Cyanobacteriota bacterium]|jgi:hypothetical protein
MAAPIASDCYAPLQHRSSALVEHCRQLVSRNDLNWLPHFGFWAMPLSGDWIEKEPALSAAHAICPIIQLGILQMPDHWVYHWHCDENRQACINMLISTNHHSHTLFGRSISNANMHSLELCYEPGCFYLFNNQVPHTVINLDVNRYLFSLEFSQPLSFAELKERFGSAGILADDAP